MIRRIIYFCLFGCAIPGCQTNLQESSDQPALSSTEEQITDTTQAYVEAIQFYLTAIEKQDSVHFDTLYIGNPELLPNIQFPSDILNKKIVLLTGDEAQRKPETNPRFVLINIVLNSLDKNKAEFMVITFHQGYQPQHNCYITLESDPSMQKFKASGELKFEYAYPR